MNKYNIIFILLFVTGISFSQTGTWHYQNPTPGPNGQNALKVISSDTIYIGAWAGVMARTFNGGVNWTTCTRPSIYGVNAIEFLNGFTGYTNGNAGEIFKTTDAGSTWSLITLPNADWYVDHINFITPAVGYIAGMDMGNNDSSFVAKTTDGGITWTDLNIKRSPKAVAKLQTFSADTIYALSFAYDFDGTSFSYSHDAGLTWSTQKNLPNAGTGNWTQGAMYFLNNNEGYLYCTSPDSILKTTDGGITWVNGGKPVLSGSDFFPQTLHYFNTNSAVAFASYGTNAILTTNAGVTWSNANLISNASWIYAMKFAKNTNVGYAIGGGGEILKTTDAGLNWTSVQGGFTRTQYGVSFTDNQNGFTCGNNGTIFKTINGGLNFTALISGTTSRLRSIQKIKNTSTLYTCGNGGIVFKSIDNGTTWLPQASGTTDDLYSLHFTNKDTGIAVGASGKIIKTLNGGTTWNTISIPFTTRLNRVEIRGNNVYIASDTTAGAQARFYKSTDLGQTFTVINLPSAENYIGISFINDSTGFICGTVGSILKTTNYGSTWATQVVNTTDDFFAIKFSDPLHGLAVGGYGLTFETADGGTTWNQNISVNQVDLFDLAYPDPNNGWAVGLTGAVAKYENNYLVTSIREATQATLDLEIYPNPTNGMLHFKADADIIHIHLYDNLGKLLLNQKINGDKTFQFPAALNAGIYFIKIQSAKSTVTKKIILTEN